MVERIIVASRGRNPSNPSDRTTGAPTEQRLEPNSEGLIKFICTFNAPLKDIDEALLRKGRLAARYEFKDLTTDKVNQLIKEESLDIPEQTHPMTLAEIYNYEGMDFSQGRKRVGF